jgi:hypothetical protein
MTVKRLLKKIVIIMFSVIVCACISAADVKPVREHRGIMAENGRVMIVPEAERFMEFAVLGLWPNQETGYFFPAMKWPALATEEQKRHIEEQFYWLNFELTHGDIIPNLPSYAHFYVGLPDKKFVPESRGREKEYFIEYLKKNVGMTEKEIRQRFEFFKAPLRLEWPQDICKVLGFDKKGRKILGYSNADMYGYPQAVKKIAQTFPDKFTLKDTGDRISMEGGDENLVFAPDNNIVFIAGRHRAIRYLNRSRGIYFDKSSISDDYIEEARSAFSQAVYGLKIMFLPEIMLANHDRGSDELFHLDMVCAVLPNPRGGSPIAFIPSMDKDSYDGITQIKFSADYVSHCQAEYDAVAGQLKELGYIIERLRFADHPVRCPVNIVRYRDRDTGEETVLLAKYPNHLPITDPNTTQAKIMRAYKNLENAYQVWYDNADSGTYNELQDSIKATSAIMDESVKDKNPIYDEWEKAFKKYGFKVVTVPTYAWGAGGLHCQLLY